MAAVPLLANDKSIGTLMVTDATHGRRFTKDEVSLLSAFADQAALALEKARLLNEAETERERADALYQVSNKLAGVHDTDEELDLIINEAIRLIGASSGHIRLLEGDTLVLRVATGANEGYMVHPPTLKVEEGTSVGGHVMATKKPLSGDAAAEVLAPEPRRAIEEIGRDPGAVAAVPLLANDQSIGILMVSDETHGRRFTEDEVSLLTAFADQASLALEKARLLNAAETRERQATQLYEVTTQLASNIGMDSVLDLIPVRAVELLGSAWAAIIRFDETTGYLSVARHHNFPPDMRNVAFKPGEGQSGRVFQERRPLWTRDAFADPSYDYDKFEAGNTVRRAMQETGTGGVLSTPILIRDEAYGTLNVGFIGTHDFTDAEIQLLQTLADSAAVAIGNARFIADTEQARDEATQLYEITEQLASADDMDNVLDLITAKATEMLESQGSAIQRFDEVSDSLLLARTYNVAPILMERYSGKPGEGVSGVAFLERRPVWSSDISTDQSLVRTEGDSSRALDEAGLKAVLAVPFIVRDEPYGVLNVIYQEPREFNTAEIRLLSTLADSAAVAIGNARYLEETEQARDEATQLQEVTAQLASTTDIDSILELITEMAKELLRSDTCAIGEYQEVRGGLVMPTSSIVLPSADQEYFALMDDAVIRPGVGTSWRAYAERRPVWSQDYLEDESFLEDPAVGEMIVEKLGLRAGMSVPIIIREEAYGVFNVMYREAHEFSEGEIQLLQSLADSAAVAIGNARFIEETQHAREDAEEGNRTKSQFLANMSHELRTPLNAIIGYSEMLQEDVQDIGNEEFEEDLERINGAGKHLLGLINDVLDISKIEAGAMDIYLETFQVDVHDPRCGNHHANVGGEELQHPGN